MVAEEVQVLLVDVVFDVDKGVEAEHVNIKEGDVGGRDIL